MPCPMCGGNTVCMDCINDECQKMYDDHAREKIAMFDNLKASNDSASNTSCKTSDNSEFLQS